jgi:excisionase family DNA binding protein
MSKIKGRQHGGHSAAYGDVAAVAAYLGVSDRTVRRLLANGLRHVKFGTGRQAGVRIRWSDLEKYLAQRTVTR